MAKYRDRLPQLDGGLFLTDGGLETSLIFHDGLDLPCFASYPLAGDEAGQRLLWDYYARYAAIARAHRTGFVLEAATWRANPDWAEKLGHGPARLKDLNRRSIALLHRLRATFEAPETPMVVSGCVGPRGDAYRPAEVMSAEEAEAYHAPQVRELADAGVDMISGMTITNAPEAAGIARAARAAAVPLAVSFTVETDGRLPSGDSLDDAIGVVDEASGRWPAYYMINCAHPSHFAATLDEGGAWVERVRGLRANASRRSHAELDEAADLDDGDPDAFGREHGALLARHRHLCVLGGCCGTDHRHVAAIARTCLALAET